MLANSCGQTYTYELKGEKVSIQTRLSAYARASFAYNQLVQAKFLGDGDFHDRNFDYLEVRVPFSDEQGPEDTLDLGYCLYEFRVYPSAEFKERMLDSSPLLLSLISAVVFFAIAVGFFVYDMFVHKRNVKIVDAAAKSNAIILSLFPAKVRDQLLAQKKWGNDTKEKVRQAHEEKDPTRLFESHDSEESSQLFDTPPIAGR